MQEMKLIIIDDHTLRSDQDWGPFRHCSSLGSLLFNYTEGVWSQHKLEPGLSPNQATHTTTQESTGEVSTHGRMEAQR